MSAVSAVDDSIALSRSPARRAPARAESASLADDALWRAQTELGLRSVELRRAREALRDESRRREAAEAALAEARQQHARDLARASRLNTTGEMAAALAHQLGQPLAATLNYLHGCQLRLRHGNPEPASLAAAIGEAIANAEQAGRIVGHVRSFVARHVPEVQPTDVHLLIRESVALLAGDLRSHGVDLSLTLADGAPQVMAEPLEIRQVLLNLIRNAIDAMAAVPEAARRLDIACDVTGNGERLRITVTDSGPGIAEADLPRVFETWFTTKRNGLGLGLAVCRAIVESHGGQLCASRHADGGAVFQFDLSLVACT